MLSQYAFIGIFAIIAFALPVIGLVLAWLIRPKKPNPAKNSTYECGMETFGDTRVQSVKNFTAPDQLVNMGSRSDGQPYNLP